MKEELKGRGQFSHPLITNTTESQSNVTDANSPDSGFRSEPDYSKLFCGQVKVSKKESLRNGKTKRKA